MESSFSATLLMTLLLAVTLPKPLIVLVVLTIEDVVETGDQRVDAVVRLVESEDRGPLEVVEKPEL